MDLFEILLLFVFFVLPLFQALLEQRQKARRRPPPPPPAEAPRPAERAEAGAGWSGDWGRWPEIGAEEAEAPGEVLAAEEVSAELPAPEVVRVADRVVSLEPVFVDHEAERTRLLARYGPETPAASRAPRAAPRIRALLGDRPTLRRAVLLAEVLGPPRALEPRSSADR